MAASVGDWVGEAKVLGASPRTEAVTVLHQPSPNVTGSQPKTITENARFPPKNTVARFAGRESRSASGMYATPASSTRPARSTTAVSPYVIVAMARETTLD